MLCSCVCVYVCSLCMCIVLCPAMLDTPDGATTHPTQSVCSCGASFTWQSASSNSCAASRPAPRSSSSRLRNTTTRGHQPRGNHVLKYRSRAHSIWRLSCAQPQPKVTVLWTWIQICGMVETRRTCVTQDASCVVSLGQTQRSLNLDREATHNASSARWARK